MTGPEIVRVDSRTVLGAQLEHAGIDLNRPVLVVVGGAAGMDSEVARALTGLCSNLLVPMLDRLGTAVVDGGTDVGVMQLMGQARASARASFPLIGVAADRTVTLPGQRRGSPGSAPAEPRHSHLVIVPGGTWGDESSWLAATATVIAGDRPSATLLINGGTIAYTDVLYSLEAGRPTVVLAGSGRAADDIARARTEPSTGTPAAAIAESPLTQVISLSEPALVLASITGILTA
ncbi:hypothetical protein IU459_25600 [Nocardia amamiensis]|uniref:LSDAT prokaryote domain-containing protein n=1 Tax=Nocardia amamiensis TaxID=404578 RepID=A0ABS0CWA9_9NOCA|nr:hypothetical protein [Nocardia amamiensis]MBF6300894.1 hypothetical protein [Nocardia amamiensis]